MNTLSSCRRVLLYFSLIAFVLSLYQLTQYWDYQTTLVDIRKELRLKVGPDEIKSEIESAISNSDFDDARMYLDIAKSNQYPIDIKTYRLQIDQKDTGLSRISKNVTQFAKGFITGKGLNSAGIAGAVSADFTVVGDVRDLHHEYKKQQQGDDVNELIVILSGTGIGLTALTVGSMGSVAPAKSGVSLIKLASKMRRLNSRFQKQLLRLGKKVFDWPLFARSVKQASFTKTVKYIPRAAKKAYDPKAVEPLKSIARQVNSVRKSTSISDTLYLLKYVETTDDLRHLEKVSVKYGSQTKGIMKLLGKGALRTVRVLRKTSELLFSILSTAFSAMLSLFLLITGRK